MFSEKQSLVKILIINASSQIFQVVLIVVAYAPSSFETCNIVINFIMLMKSIVKSEW